jgi:hypothetical protein
MISPIIIDQPALAARTGVSLLTKEKDKKNAISHLIYE